MTEMEASDWLPMDEPVAKWMEWGGPNGAMEFGDGEHVGLWRMLKPHTPRQKILDLNGWVD